MLDQRIQEAKEIRLRLSSRLKDYQRRLAKAAQDHADPRLIPKGIAAARAKVKAINFGEAKARMVPRLDIAKNWFRNGHFWRGKHPA